MLCIILVNFGYETVYRTHRVVHWLIAIYTTCIVVVYIVVFTELLLVLEFVSGVNF